MTTSRYCIENIEQPPRRSQKVVLLPHPKVGFKHGHTQFYNFEIYPTILNIAPGELLGFFYETLPDRDIKFMGRWLVISGKVDVEAILKSFVRVHIKCPGCNNIKYEAHVCLKN